MCYVLRTLIYFHLLKNSHFFIDEECVVFAWFPLQILWDDREHWFAIVAGNLFQATVVVKLLSIVPILCFEHALVVTKEGLAGLGTDFGKSGPLPPVNQMAKVVQVQIAMFNTNSFADLLVLLEDQVLHGHLSCDFREPGIVQQQSTKNVGEPGNDFCNVVQIMSVEDLGNPVATD